MSATHIESLTLSGLTPTVVVANDAEGVITDSPMVQSGNDFAVAGDLDGFTYAIGGRLDVTGDSGIGGGLAVAGHVDVSSLAGTGVRPVAADPSGKFCVARPGTQQAYALHAPTSLTPSGATPLFIFEGSGIPSGGSLVVPRNWLRKGNALSLSVVFEWTKQSGAGIDLFFGIAFQPEDSSSETLTEFPVLLAADELGSDTGCAALETEIHLLAGAEDGSPIFFAASVLSNRSSVSGGTVVSRVTAKTSVDLDEEGDARAVLRPYARFSSPTGTNSVTVLAASLVSRELQPLD